MAHLKEILLLLPLLLCIEAQNHTDLEPVEELIQAETKDGKLEIVKRIKKVNPDGSYTIGYEADDGSFKIESRDVLGNIKGTYGFVDDEGEIKRVSYSSSNASDIFPNKPELIHHSSVVQRIPKSTTQRPSSSTSSVPFTTTPLSVIQSIARRRLTQGSTTSTTKPNVVVYSSAAPRVLLQRPSFSKAPEGKSEVQINRPEASAKETFSEDIKPVTEEISEVRSNVLRRQTVPEPTFSTQEHVYGLQQSFGHNDLPDVYNTVTSRPLFTTSRPLIRSTTTAPQIAPNVETLQRNQLQEVESRQKVAPEVTPEPLVAIRHPFQQGAILVPLSQLQNRILPVENMQEVYNARRSYSMGRQQVKRLIPPALRPLPVQVDANGFIREMPQHAPYPLPVPVTPTEAPGQDVDQIQPPVSTRDFHTLLNHLIRRQKMLERISELTLRRPVYQQRVPLQRPHGGFQGEEAGGRAYRYQYQPSLEYASNRRLAVRGYQQVEEAEASQPEEYLPADVRESLLLRMLQLAINPALPLQPEEEEAQPLATSSTLHYRQAPMRNVEILGEEAQEDVEAKKRRAKRYQDEDMEYME